jgi:pimeloyl-ACP methyl ester carboxylesterase
MRHFVTSDGLTLAYRDEGEGIPLLCLPGLTRNGQDFEPVVQAFADRARIIRLDLRGRGASDYDRDYRNYNVLVEARDAIELMDHLGLARVAILGTSRGGLIALTLAAMARDRLTGIVFNDIGPHIDPAGLARIIATLGIAPAEPTLNSFAEAFARDAAAAFPGVSVAQWRVFLAHTLRETPDGIALRYDPKLRDAVLESLKGHDNWPDLWPIFDLCEGLPLLLLRGENSDVLSPETAAEMRHRRPDMRYVLVRDRGHIPFLDEPECRDALSDFLAVLPR